MFKLTLNSLLARKIRLALTTFAVVLGVSFVSGSFILADSLRAVFDKIAIEIAGPDWLQVRGVETIEDDPFSRPTVPQAVVDQIRSTEGVYGADGVIQGFPRISFGEELIKPLGGAPTLAFNFSEENAELSSFEAVEGSAPGDGEAMVDIDTAAKYGISVGDTITIRSLQPEEDFTVSGITRWGQDNGGGAVFVLIDTPTAQRLFNYPDSYLAVTVGAMPGVDENELANKLTNQLPSGFEAVTSEVVANEFSDQFDIFITIFQNALLVFAAVALIVSAFIINNTFAIVLGQRIRELGLLRAVGATGRQIRSSVLTEALLIGVVASLVGVFAGTGIAWSIKALIAQVGDGSGLPDGPLIIATRTWIAAAIVGIGVTLLAAISPARRASRIPPIAALRDDLSLWSGNNRRRTVVGLLFGVGGLLATAFGTTSNAGASRQLALLASGALLLFVSISLLSTLIARPAARLLGWPMTRFARASGNLARENASRNPRRTASTASALMVGLALVGMVLVVGTSFKKTFSSALDSSLGAEFFIDTEGRNSWGFSPQLVEDIKEIDGVAIAVGFRGGPGTAQMSVAGASKDVIGTQEEGLGRVLDLSLIEGTYSGLSNGGVLVHEDPAEDLALAVGDVVSATFPVAGKKDLRVVGIFDDGSILGNWVIDMSTYETGFDPARQSDLFAAIKLEKGVEVQNIRSQLDAVAANYPEAILQDRTEYQETIEGRIDTLLMTVNALVGFAVIIAVLGIVNTLMLSVFERTREIGLLRAVGMTRRQTRRMIRWEAVIIAVFGGVLGILVGTLLGFIAVQAMPDSFITDFGIPVGNFVIILVMCIVVGVLAAILPARRAARLNILDAVAHS
ncbi:MAG: ABC transporter permease [Candidatus Poriferisodalaceae bacterium]